MATKSDFKVEVPESITKYERFESLNNGYEITNRSIPSSKGLV